FEDVRVSLSIKNLFGMIPTPWRGKFHGKDNALLDQSILNINKVYHSLFEVRGVLESVFSTSDYSDKLLDPMIYRNQPFIWGSNELVELDALVASQLGLDPHGISHLAGFAEQLGPWYHDTVDIGRMNPIEFSP
ncbi:MAG: hypothetical protein ACFE7R_07925, partial [Candidatus Hodarchaeota archaeon]